MNATTLSVIAGACRDRERLRFHYRSQNGAESQRNVEPSGLVHTGRRWYLVAWDVGREDWRTFRVDRIQTKVTTSVRFLPRKPPDDDLAKFVSRSVASAPYPIQGRVILRAPIQQIAERVSPTAAFLQAIDAHSCELLTGAPSLDALTAWVALLGVDFEVREPPELLDRMRSLADRIARALTRVPSAH